MDKRGQMTLGVILFLFIGIVVAFALLTPIATQQALMTDKQITSNQSTSTITAYVEAEEVNETINFTIYDQSTWKQAECPLSSVVMRNGVGTALTATTDYIIYTDAGVFSLLNTSKTVPATSLNLTYTDYTFCEDGYNTNAGARSMIGLVLLFCALALVAFVLEKLEIIDIFGR